MTGSYKCGYAFLQIDPTVIAYIIMHSTKYVFNLFSVIAKCLNEIDHRLENPEPPIEGWDFNDIHIRFLRLKIRDKTRVINHLWNFAA